MSETKEWLLYLSIILVLGTVLISEGRTNIDLKRSQEMSAKQLYRDLAATGRSIQLVDVRPYDEGDDDPEYTSYQEAHIPGSIPIPGCDSKIADREAFEMVNPYTLTVLISKNGTIDGELKAKCSSLFIDSIIMVGGMVAWAQRDYPEEDGEYVAPPIGGGGGCL
ncbi:MAG: rhodanese-like domain-containing protein [Bdellovibrionales bacterium]|jgi:rhodanese-related sulfurtransferase|nr:rhodanese-like domain-containing protein [Bdellovibrionales bacterium]MBT3525351.1 rhodanese-like domain-containing protein [Bdellovibrionales bacterium]MBT7765507.1 rhodanese-like domain-containing protein [Bdellovibrionales bacterium]